MRLARAVREIPESRMSQLPTNPILDRSGTSVLTGEYQQDSPSMLLRATRPHSPLDASPVISTPQFCCERSTQHAVPSRHAAVLTRCTTSCWSALQQQSTLDIPFDGSRNVNLPTVIERSLAVFCEVVKGDVAPMKFIRGEDLKLGDMK